MGRIYLNELVPGHGLKVVLLSPLLCVITGVGLRLKWKGESHDCFVENGDY